MLQCEWEGQLCHKTLGLVVQQCRSDNGDTDQRMDDVVQPVMPVRVQRHAYGHAYGQVYGHVCSDGDRDMST